MKKKRDGLMLFLYLLIGAVVGSILGEVLGTMLPFLQKGIVFGLMPPAELDLWFMDIVFGFRFQLNLAGALGLIAALFVYRR